MDEHHFVGGFNEFCFFCFFFFHFHILFCKFLSRLWWIFPDLVEQINILITLTTHVKFEPLDVSNQICRFNAFGLTDRTACSPTFEDHWLSDYNLLLNWQEHESFAVQAKKLVNYIKITIFLDVVNKWNWCSSVQMLSIDGEKSIGEMHLWFQLISQTGRYRR